MPETLVVVGALARVARHAEPEVRAALEQLDGVSVFDVATEGQLGVLIEATSLDGAHAALAGGVSAVPGVLAAWPVSVEVDGPEVSVEESDERIPP